MVSRWQRQRRRGGVETWRRQALAIYGTNAQSHQKCQSADFLEVCLEPREPRGQGGSEPYVDAAKHPSRWTLALPTRRLVPRCSQTGRPMLLLCETSTAPWASLAARQNTVSCPPTEHKPLASLHSTPFSPFRAASTSTTSARRRLYLVQEAGHQSWLRPWR